MRFYTRCKMHINPVLPKNYSFHDFLNRSNFAFVFSFQKKHSLSLTRNTLFLCFSFSDIITLFSHFFNEKLFICIHLNLFMHTIQNNTILSSSNITYWKPGIFLVKVQNALCRLNTRPLIRRNSKTITNYIKELPNKL